MLNHSTALQEKLWAEIADFVLAQPDQLRDIELPPNIKSSLDHKWWVKYPAYVAPIIWVLILALVVFFLYQILQTDISEWLKTISVLGYLAFIWIVLTRV